MIETPVIDLSTIPAAQRAAVLALMEKVAALTEITQRQEHLIAELQPVLRRHRARLDRADVVEVVEPDAERGGALHVEDDVKRRDVQRLLRRTAAHGASRRWQSCAGANSHRVACGAGSRCARVGESCSQF